MKRIRQHKKGFTLIEITVVIIVILIALPVFFQLVFNLTRAQVNLTSLQKVKQDGDFIRQSIINTLRNKYYTIDPTCSDVSGIPVGALAKVCFTDISGESFGYAVSGSANNYQIASYSATTVVLNNPSASFPTRITAATFTQKNDYTVQFNYTIKHVAPVSYLASPDLTYDFFVITRVQD